MKRLALALACFIAIGVAIVFYGARPALGTNPPSDSMVKVMTETGHGSGVHIGGGLVLTAEHVVQDLKSVRLKLTNSQIIRADVLWTSPASDVALVRAEYPHRMASARVDCRPLVVGEEISIYGNPLNVDAMRTYGRVGGLPARLASGPASPRSTHPLPPVTPVALSSTRTAILWAFWWEPHSPGWGSARPLSAYPISCRQGPSANFWRVADPCPPLR